MQFFCNERILEKCNLLQGRGQWRFTLSNKTTLGCRNSVSFVKRSRLTGAINRGFYTIYCYLVLNRFSKQFESGNERAKHKNVLQFELGKAKPTLLRVPEPVTEGNPEKKITSPSVHFLRDFNGNSFSPQVAHARMRHKKIPTTKAIGIYYNFSDLFTQNTSRNNDFLDFRSAFINLCDFRIAHHAFYMVFRYITIATVDLDGLDGRIHSHLRRI